MHKKSGIPFIKMHGLGNDFILVRGEDWPETFEKSSAAKRLCNRHFGIGADGLIIIVPPDMKDCELKWLFYNADGSQAEMCGNGVRCLARYAVDNGLVKGPSFGVETLAGRIELTMLPDGRFRVDVVRPSLRRALIPMAGPDADKVVGETLKVGDRAFIITALSMGNPHCVCFLETVDSFPLEKYGPLLENHPAFPERVNASFATIVDRSHIKARVWERGVGETLACGTAACAVAVAAVLNGLAERNLTVTLPGGDLEINWDEGKDRVLMTGPAQYAFTGEFFRQGNERK